MDYDWLPLGDRACLMRFGERADEAMLDLVQAARQALHAARLPGVTGFGQSFAALALELDPLALERHGGEAGLRERVAAALATLRRTDDREPRPVQRIPVRYGGADGPDLDLVARALGMDPGEVVERHTAVVYRVAMIGFRPGFPYLLGLPEALHLPRREQPRARVAAGSVAIAGVQAGIYPEESPGGWHLLGRTTVRLFDPHRGQPAMLTPGDLLRFVAED